MTTVLIADDQALVRVGLRKILDAEPETDIVGEADDGEDAVSEARRLRPESSGTRKYGPGISASRSALRGE